MTSDLTEPRPTSRSSMPTIAARAQARFSRTQPLRLPAPPQTEWWNVPDIPFWCSTYVDDTVAVEWGIGTRTAHATTGYMAAIDCVLSPRALHMKKFWVEGTFEP